MQTTPLLETIDAFLAETGMGAAYFGKRAVGNSELVARLRAGRRVWPETEGRVLAFIVSHRASLAGEVSCLPGQDGGADDAAASRDVLTPKWGQSQ